jgi:aspartyl-tRNA(Asn)/glutamyl-tRNA(Gln) amidotransferase subunit A
MKHIDLASLTIEKAHASLASREYSVLELAQAYLEVGLKKNKEINGYLELFSDIEEQARIAQERFDTKTATLLTGIPCAVKDNILITGKISSASSKMLENYVAPYDATAIAKLKEQGVVFIGRTNMDEFAMGGSTENSAFGVTKNPHDTSRVAGGSSGGSAAVVAMNGALIALGSDTGGSVRQPASFCGVVGLKPTYGSVSRHGLMAMASSLDVIGPITKTTRDAQIVYEAIAAKDPLDSTSVDSTQYSRKAQKGKPVIGVPWDFVRTKGVDAGVLKNFEETISRLEEKGYQVQPISLASVQYALAVYYIVMPAEVSSNLARFDGVRYGLHVPGVNLLDEYLNSRGQGFGAEVRRRILLGTYVLSSGYYDAYYGKALQAREKIREEFTNAFRQVDCILTPTSPVPAFKIGEKSHDPLSMYLADIFTVTANIVGIPALSVPSGVLEVDGVKLPLGIQCMSDFAREDILFTLGTDLEALA